MQADGVGQWRPKSHLGATWNAKSPLLPRQLRQLPLMLSEIVEIWGNDVQPPDRRADKSREVRPQFRGGHIAVSRSASGLVWEKASKKSPTCAVVEVTSQSRAS